MPDVKPWYLSRGFLGPLVTAVLLALRQLGVVDLDAESVLGWVYQCIEIGGALLGMYGRATAKARLKFS